MNVTCTGCPAKYAVPDEKVRGKKVRITCKHCGTNIVVDGTAFDTSADAAPKPAAHAPQPSAANKRETSGAMAKAAQGKASAAPTEVMYIVGFADDRQETHTIAQIVELYGAGKLDQETLVWKDGMADWVSPFDVPELAAAFRAKNVAPRTAAVAPAPGFNPVAEDEATLVVRSPLDDPEVAAAIAASQPSVPPTAAVAAPAEAAPKPTAEPEPVIEKPTAARRAEKRGGAVDLFGQVAAAGSEGDVSLDLGASDDRGQKLTGARNESSVLFSLDALTKPDQKASQVKAKEREREASEALFGESAPDSLMNLGGAGLNAMAAPDFTKPVSAVAPPVRLGDSLETADAPSKGRGGMVLLVGFLAIAAVAGVAFFMMKKQQQPANEAATATPSATTQARASAEPSSEAPAASNAPSASAEPAASASASAAASAGSAPSAAPAAPAASAPSAAPAASVKPSTAAAPATPAAPAAAAAATPAAAAAATKPAETAAAAKPAEAPAPAEGAAFDKNAAVAALSAAAASAASCKTADGPTGSGKVSVTFAPSGRATATSVAGDLAGTEVGGCVARIFRSAKVPPFSGDPVTVSKSFTIQ
ncbi:MAG TPA: zinc-ribbon domain-containing protein [Polyangiaceae bacterium]|nr:zinc-ribbon domain-containing protein [Polyangiaceae bacterium]